MSTIDLIFPIVLTILAVKTSARCPPGFVQGHTVHSCYTYKVTPLPWQEAVKECLVFNGHLPVIEKYMENLFISTLPNIQLAQYYWIGASRGMVAADNGSWTWPDGAPVKFANWNHCKNGTPDSISLSDVIFVIVKLGLQGLLERLRSIVTSHFE